VKLLVDMNLPPKLGTAAGAPRVRGCPLVHDLDFSAILAATAAATPSVVQIRTHDVLSDAVVGIVANALKAHEQDIEQGALLSIDESGTRVRMLPLGRS